MLLQTNSYIVPKDKRAEHARLLRRFRASLAKLGCDSFEVYEQVGSNWSTGEPTGRYVQIMRFRDRRHQLAVQAAERTDPSAQAIIAEFCQLINFPYQQQQGLFAVGFYNSVLPVAPSRPQPGQVAVVAAGAGEVAQDSAVAGPDAGGAEAAEQVTDTHEHAAESLAEPEIAPEVNVDSVTQGHGEALAEGSEDAGVEQAPVAEVDRVNDAVHVADDEAVPDVGEVPPTAEEVNDLGALLESHSQPEAGVEPSGDGETPVAEAEVEADDGAVAGLDAMDLDELDLPDDPANEPDRASKHVAH